MARRELRSRTHKGTDLPLRVSCGDGSYTVSTTRLVPAHSSAEPEPRCFTVKAMRCAVMPSLG
jgi:hypothetical protein